MTRYWTTTHYPTGCSPLDVKRAADRQWAIADALWRVSGLPASVFYA